jgi:hypothetical protein
VILADISSAVAGRRPRYAQFVRQIDQFVPDAHFMRRLYLSIEQWRA